MSIKLAPLRRHKAKKLKFDSAPCQDSTLPPPTPISTLQVVGEALGVAPEDLTVEKLTASPKPDPQPDSSNDEWTFLCISGASDLLGLLLLCFISALYARTSELLWSAVRGYAENCTVLLSGPIGYFLIISVIYGDYNVS